VFPGNSHLLDLEGILGLILMTPLFLGQMEMELDPTDLLLDLDTFPLLLEELMEDPHMEQILLLASSNDLLASAPASVASVSWVEGGLACFFAS
jgi:hypothetical protein